MGVSDVTRLVLLAISGLKSAYQILSALLNVQSTITCDVWAESVF